MTALPAELALLKFRLSLLVKLGANAELLTMPPPLTSKVMPVPLVVKLNAGAPAVNWIVLIEASLEIVTEVGAALLVNAAVSSGTSGVELQFVPSVHSAPGPARVRPAAYRQARLGVVAADDRVDRVAVAVESQDRAGGHHFAHRQAAGDVSNGVRRRDDTEPAAQGCEPFELLTLLELGDHRGIVDDADESRIADVAGAYGVELCTLAGVIQVSLDAGEQHPAGEPVVAGLGAADRSIESARSARREH